MSVLNVSVLTVAMVLVLLELHESLFMLGFVNGELLPFCHGG